MDPKLEGVTTEVWNGPWEPWLKNLNDAIWGRTAPSKGFPKGMGVESRRLTDDEWNTVKMILAGQRDLIYDLTNACMGFGCGMYIGRMVPSTFPGVPHSVEWIAFITKNHLPLSVCELRSPTEHGADCKDRTFFEDGWRAFSPYTHSEANTKNLKVYGLEAPKSKDHYEY
jgi:hypothetical protein